jgi:arylsulfatase A-like enzyme
MNFQAVSVAQKAQAGGIDVDSNGNEIPSAEFTDALTHTDQSVGQIVQALKKNNLFDSTLVVVTAKHGQNPRLGSATLVKDSIITDALKAAGIGVAQATQDDVSLLWLKDQSQANEAAQVIQALQAQNQTCGGTVQQNCNPAIDKIFSGDGLVNAGFGNPSQDTRTPDVIVKLKPGYVLVGNLASTVKRAEHGGLNDDDTHVALIVGSGGLPVKLQGTTQTQNVTTTQVAVTTLQALGLNCNQLQGAAIENTQPLPGLNINFPESSFGGYGSR